MRTISQVFEELKANESFISKYKKKAKSLGRKLANSKAARFGKHLYSSNHLDN